MIYWILLLLLFMIVILYLYLFYSLNKERKQLRTERIICNKLMEEYYKSIIELDKESREDGGSVCS